MKPSYCTADTDIYSLLLQSNYTNCGTLVLLSTEMNLIFPLSKSVCVYLRYTIIVPSGLISCDCLLFCFRIKEQKSPSSHRESTRRKRLNLITKMHKTQRPALAGCLPPQDSNLFLHSFIDHLEPASLCACECSDSSKFPLCSARPTDCTWQLWYEMYMPRDVLNQ